MNQSEKAQAIVKDYYPNAYCRLTKPFGHNRSKYQIFSGETPNGEIALGDESYYAYGAWASARRKCQRRPPKTPKGESKVVNIYLPLSIIEAIGGTKQARLILRQFAHEKAGEKKAIEASLPSLDTLHELPAGSDAKKEFDMRIAERLKNESQNTKNIEQ